MEETLSLGGVSVYTSVYHGEGFKRNKLKDAGRGGGKGSDLVKVDAEGNIEGLGRNIFAAAREKGDAFAQRLFTASSYEKYVAWTDRNPLIGGASGEKPYKNKRDKWVCSKCNKTVVYQAATCGNLKCGVDLDWT